MQSKQVESQRLLARAKEIYQKDSLFMLLQKIIDKSLVFAQYKSQQKAFAQRHFVWKGQKLDFFIVFDHLALMCQLSFMKTSGFRVQRRISESKLVGVKTKNFWYTSLRFFHMLRCMSTKHLKFTFSKLEMC